MTRRAIALALVLCGLSVSSAQAQQVAAPPNYYPTGSLAGTGLWDCYLCDLLGVRNIQGGKLTGNRDDLNLDIGAGSTEHPGSIVFQYDVGTGRVVFYDGRMHKTLAVGPRKIVAYVPIVVRRHR